MSEEVTIRKATLEDMAGCAAILNEWIDATDWMPRVHPHEDVVRHYNEFVFNERIVSVIDSARQILGYSCLSSDNFVTSLYIKASERGTGLGNRLMDHAKSIRPAGLHLWTFVAISGGRRFYEREGFVETSRTDGDNEEGLPDILYSWGKLA